ALSRYFLRHPLSSSLPRKFKIAFEGCPEDHAVTAIHDIGWRARVEVIAGAAGRGLCGTIGGGPATFAEAGAETSDARPPAAAVLEVAEAIVRVFHRLGDYKHKQKNRMKFLVRALGFAGWRAEFEKALAEVRDEGGVRPPFDPEDPGVETAPDWTRSAPPSVGEAARRAASAEVRGPGIVSSGRLPLRLLGGVLSSWTATNVRPQKQSGYAVATVTVPLVDLTGAQLRILADLALAYSDGTVRVTQDQDLLFRWVPVDDLPELHRRLVAARLGLAGANTLADVTSCPGAESCRPAGPQSRGPGQPPRDHPPARGGPVATA